MRAYFTYDKTTCESAASGSFSEHGWLLPGMWEYPIEDEDGYYESTLEYAKNGKFDLTDLGEVINFAESLGICEDSGNWLSSIDPDIDYQSGENTFYSLHIEGVTASTYNRIKRLLGIRQ